MGETDAALAVLEQLDRRDEAARALHRELGVLPERTQITRTLHDAGMPLSEALSQSPGPASHEVVAERAERYVEALHAYRVAIVRHLVDQEGLSLTEISDRFGCARQVVSRLYHAPGLVVAGARPAPKVRLRAAAATSRDAR